MVGTGYAGYRGGKAPESDGWIAREVEVLAGEEQSSVHLAYWEDLLPGHGGALEEQGPGREGCVLPSLQDTKHEGQFIMSQRCKERWLPAQDAPFHIG